MRRRSWVTRGRGAKRRGGQGWANTNQRAECLRRTEVGIVVAVRTSMLPCVLSIVRRWVDGSGACSWQLVASWWLMQEVLRTMHCTAVIPWACSWGSPRPKCTCGTSVTAAA